MVAQNVIFGAIAAAMAAAAVRVVTTKNIVHAALYLVVVLAGVAALYILLAAEFTAVVQVLVYIGAIVVLFLFGIMLTRAELGSSDDLDNKGPQKAVAGVVGVLGAVLNDAFGSTKLASDTTIQKSADVGNSIFQDYVIPFEVVSILLLAALIGAVVIARRD